MNALPEHRRAVNGRTWPQPWSAASMDPFEHHRRVIPATQRVLSVLLAFGLGLAGAMLLVHWWSH